MHCYASVISDAILWTVKNLQLRYWNLTWCQQRRGYLYTTLCQSSAKIDPRANPLGFVSDPDIKPCNPCDLSKFSINENPQ